MQTGITIQGPKPGPLFIPLDADLLEAVLRIARSLRNAPRWPEDSDQRKKASEERRAALEAKVNAFRDIVAGLARLREREVRCVLGLMELFEFGEGHLAESNWVLTLVMNLLLDVAGDGPSEANDFAFADATHWLADGRDHFEGWIKDAVVTARRYPATFAQHGSVQAEEEVCDE